jgi:cupin fold WbuC family metalloprotein
VNDRPDFLEVSSGVLRATGDRVEITADVIGDLVARAGESRNTHRILLHPGIDDPIQEMLIVHPRGVYIRPHKLMTTSKTYNVIQGELEIVMFDGNGAVIEHHRMRPLADGGPSVTRIMKDGYHSIVAVTDTVTFIEVLPGPFDGTVFADWAPESDGSKKADAFFDYVLGQIGLLQGDGQ